MSDAPQGPAVPEVTDEVWRALIEASLSFRELAPWKWMRDEDLFGFELPGTRTLHIGCILPATDGPPALVVYRGEAGIRYLFRTSDDPGLPLDPETPAAEDSVIMELCGRRELDPPDLEVRRRLGLPKPEPARHGYPRFRSQLPAHLPWYIDATEAQMLTIALGLAQGFASLVDEKPDFYGDRPFHEIPVYRRVGAADDAPWRLDWTALDLARPPVPAGFVPAAPLLHHVRDLPRLPDGVLELTTYLAPKVIDAHPRPYYPRTALVVDATSGNLLSALMEHPGEPEGTVAGRCLFDTLVRVGRRPQAVVVSSPALAESLGPALEASGILLRYRCHPDRTPAVQQALARKFEEERERAEGSSGRPPRRSA